MGFDGRLKARVEISHDRMKELLKAGQSMDGRLLFDDKCFRHSFTRAAQGSEMKGFTRMYTTEAHTSRADLVSSSRYDQAAL